MNSTSLKGSWKVATIMGIPMWVHFSWLIVFGLITWLLSSRYFPIAAPDLPIASYWVKGLLAALLLFASVAFHELAHSYVAQKYKLSIESITLFIFGGVAQMKGEPPASESRILDCNRWPPLKLFPFCFFYILMMNAAAGSKALFAYLAQINFIIGVFNLIPGFPMDGGRVLRSVIWRRKRDYFYATQKASIVERMIAMLTLSGIKVKDIMVTDLKTLSPSITIDKAMDEYFLRYGYGGFPVIDDGKCLGIVTLKEVKNIPREDWGRVKASDILVPHDKKWEVPMDDDVMKALELMIKEDKGRVVVKEKDRIIGLITRNGIARYVEIKGK